MIDALRIKKWATPLTVGAFLVQGITGILLFFHVEVGALSHAHEDLGWLLVIGVVFHISLNWKSLLKYFTTPIGVAVVLIVLAIGGLFVFGPREGGHGFGERERNFSGGGPGFTGGGRALIKASRALTNSSLDTVAKVVKAKPESLVEKLKENDLVVKNSKQTISEIASDNNIQDTEVLNYTLSD